MCPNFDIPNNNIKTDLTNNNKPILLEKGE